MFHIQSYVEGLAGSRRGTDEWKNSRYWCFQLQCLTCVNPWSSGRDTASRKPGQLFNCWPTPKSQALLTKCGALAHPLYGSDDGTLQACRRHGIIYCAYSPLGLTSKVQVLGNPTVWEVASSHNYNPAQMALRWAVQLGVPVITSSSKPAHVDQVLFAPQLKLSDEETDVLEKV